MKCRIHAMCVESVISMADCVQAREYNSVSMIREIDRKEREIFKVFCPDPQGNADRTVDLRSLRRVLKDTHASVSGNLFKPKEITYTRRISDLSEHPWISDRPDNPGCLWNRDNVRRS